MIAAVMHGRRRPSEVPLTARDFVDLHFLSGAWKAMVAAEERGESPAIALWRKGRIARPVLDLPPPKGDDEIDAAVVSVMADGARRRAALLMRRLAGDWASGGYGHCGDARELAELVELLALPPEMLDATLRARVAAARRRA